MLRIRIARWAQRVFTKPAFSIALFLVTTAPAMAQTIRVENYRVYYDPAPHGRRATWANVVPDGRRLDMVFTDFVEDDEAGALPYLVHSTDGGGTWSDPVPLALGFIRTLGDPQEVA